MGIPVAAFPSRIATAADLKVANNGIQTTLAGPVGPTDTSFKIASGTGFAANQLVSIDTEIVAITGISGTTVTVGQRGFDGSAAAGHNSGAPVRLLVDAWHHNAVSAELMAVENFIGVNGTNLGAVRTSASYNFAAQSPGGSLVVGNNSITLTPVPQGVNGTDTNHYLYVSGGTGTAEPVLITGGSAVSGAASGTLIIQCANTHSGAWTIQSATAGIQEAIVVLGSTGGSVQVPIGIWNLQGPITIPYTGTAIRGSVQVGTLLSFTYTAGDLIVAPNNTSYVTISNCQITAPSSGTHFAISLINQAEPLIENVLINQGGGGISITGNTQSQLGVFRNIVINGVTGDGVYINTTHDGGSWYNTIIGSPATSGFHVTATAGLHLRDVYTNGCAQGLTIDPGSGQKASIIFALNAYFDGYNASSNYGILLNPTNGGNINTLNFTQGAGCGFNYGLFSGTGTGTIQDVTFDGTLFQANNHQGIAFNSPSITMNNITLANCFVEANSQASSGTDTGLYLGSVSNVIVRGGVYAAGGYANGLNTQKYGIIVAGSTSNIKILQAVLTPNVTAPLLISGTNTNLIIKDAIGYNPVGQSAITVGASPFTYTAGSSAEVIYIYGGTVSSIKVGSTQVATASPATVTLGANSSVQVTYSAAPTMVKDVQ